MPTSAARGALNSGWARAALGIAVSLVFLYWALHDVKAGAVARELAAANLWLIGLSALGATLTFPTRAVRWRIILAAGDRRAAFSPVWRATAIGFMANNVLPARMGELARAYAVSRLGELPLGAALASIFVERTFDGLVLVFLLAVAIAAPGFPADATVGDWSVSTLAMLAGGIFSFALVALFLLVHAPQSALALGGRLLRGALPARFAELAVSLIRGFSDGLSVLRARRDFARVVAWSFALWLLNAAAFYVGFLAFGLDHAPFSGALLLQGIVALGVAIPSSPGFFGPFEAMSRASLGLYGVPKDPAVSFAVGIHLAWFIPITVIGLWYLGRANLSLRQLRGEAGGR